MFCEKLGVQDRRGGQVAEPKLDARVAQLRSLGLGCEPVGLQALLLAFDPMGKPLFSGHSGVPIS